MLKPAVTATLLALVLVAKSAHADTETTTADTLVVVTPNAPVIVQQGGPSSVTQPIQAPGSEEIPPMPPAARNGAPQNEDWNNVSHINGTPVKVGERGDYLYKFKKNNISGNPFLLFFSAYDLGFAHALGQNMAASASVMGVKDEFFQLSGTLPIYFRRTFSGPFLEPGLIMRTEKTYSDCYDSCGMEMKAWVGPQLMFGWHWTFDSGLNISFALGVAKKLNNNSDYDPGVEPNGYFRIGYAF